MGSLTTSAPTTKRLLFAKDAQAAEDPENLAINGKFPVSIED